MQEILQKQGMIGGKQMRFRCRKTPINLLSIQVFGAGGAPQLQSKTVTPSTSQKTVGPDNGYDGLSSVQVNAISPTKGAQTYTPTTTNQTISSGRWLTGAQTIKGDANLVASNIKSGVSIFGVSGTLEEGLYQTTTSTITNNSRNKRLTIQNLGFPIYSSSNIVSLSIELISDSPDDLTAIAWHYNYYSNYIACCIFDNNGTNEYWENTYSGGGYYIIDCNGSNIKVGFTSYSNTEFSSGTYKYTLVVKKE